MAKKKGEINEEYFRSWCGAACGPGIWTTVLGVLFLAWGVTWLGNSLGWWNYDFPFWPVVLILIGLGIIVKAFMKRY